MRALFYWLRRAALWALLLACATGSGAAPTTYFVATNGNDAWDGLAAAFTAGSNGPLATLHEAAQRMKAGDATFVRGGFYNCTNYPRQYFDPRQNSVTLSNYPGEVPLFANQRVNPKVLELLSVSHLSGVRIFGLHATNCQRTAGFYAVTNLELAYCDFGFSDTNYALNGMVQLSANSRTNWIHDNRLHDKQHDNVVPKQADKGTPLLIGNGESVPSDVTAFNLIERNVLFRGGHDAIQIQSSFNIIRSNWFHNEPWVWWDIYNQFGGHRCIDVEPRCQSNVIEDNWVAYASLALANPSGNGMEICGSSNIVRGNAVVWCQQVGILLYGTKDGTKPQDPQCCDNHVYNNTLAWNSLGQNFTTNRTNGFVKDYTGNKFVLQVNHGTNNVFVNNLLAFNGGNLWFKTPPNDHRFVACRERDNQWGRQWRDNGDGDPKFVSRGTGVSTLVPGVRSQVGAKGVLVTGSPTDPPNSNINLHLRPDSPCLGAGEFLTKVTSESGSGREFAVADALFFTDGYGLVPGDEIQLEGSRERMRLLHVDWRTRILTTDRPLSWTKGQKVALAYERARPDMGAFGPP